MEPSIKCPGCGREIALDEALLGPVQERVAKQYQSKLRKLQQQLEAAETEATAKAEKAATAKLGEERRKIEARAREAVMVDMGELRQQAQEAAERLKNSQAQELELRKELRDTKRSADEGKLELQRQIDAERERISKEVQKQFAESWEIQKKQYETQIARLTEQIDSLNQAANVTSQQLQGEAMEAALEDLLRRTFPIDGFEAIRTGKEGADILQTVRSPRGGDVGKILWESKNTKNWGNAWLEKLRKDQREAEAEAAVIVSRVLPDEVDGFAPMEGVVVCDFRRFLPLAAVLRQHILELARHNRAEVSRATKQELLYDFVASTSFRQALQGIGEAILHSEEELLKERAYLTKVWKRREEQLTRGLTILAELYGGLQDKLGTALPDIPALSHPQTSAPALESPTPTNGASGDKKQPSPE